MLPIHLLKGIKYAICSSLYMVLNFEGPFRYVLLPFCQLFGISLESVLMGAGSSTHPLGLLRCFGMGCSRFHGYQHFIQAYFQLVCAYGWR